MPLSVELIAMVALVVVVVAMLSSKSKTLLPTWLTNIVVSKYFFVLAMLLAYQLPNKYAFMTVSLVLILIFCTTPRIQKESFTNDQNGGRINKDEIDHDDHNDYDDYGEYTHDNSIQSPTRVMVDETQNSMTASMEQDIVDKLWFPESNVSNDDFNEL